MVFAGMVKEKPFEKLEVFVTKEFLVKGGPGLTSD